MFKSFLSFVVLILSLSAVAQQKPDESHLIPFYNSTIAPYFETMGAPIDFQGAKGVRLRGYEFLRGSTAVVIVPGWLEPAHKWAETAYDLNQAGLSVFVYSHRGQGESDRIIPCHCTYVESYQYYADDLVTFVNQVVKPKHFKKVFLLAHSMGGGIAALALQQHPDLVDAAILSSPLLRANTAPWPEPVAQTIEKAAVAAGKGKARRPFDKDVPDDFAHNTVTNSNVRWSINDQLMTQHPELKSGWASNQWLNEIFKMTNAIRNSKSLIAMPILLLQAQNDQFVIDSTQNQLCAKWAHCELHQIPNTKHELFEERDPARNAALALALRFFNK